jgi:hypothetical protein
MAQPQIDQSQPYSPSVFDQLQLAFGVDNPQTRQLAALRAGGELPVAPQIQPAPVQAPDGSGFFGGQGLTQYLQQRFQEMSREAAPIGSGNTRNAAALAAAGAGNPISAASLQKIGQ